MDKRVKGLLRDFPAIFEKRPPRIGELDDDWVIIEVPVDRSEQSGTHGEAANDRSRVSEDDFLSDLDRFEDDFDDPMDQNLQPEEPASPVNILRPEIDLDPRVRREIINRRRPKAIDDLRRRIKGEFPGSPTDGTVPPPDALAFYLPFHIFPDMWGIYLLDVGVESLAVDLRRIMFDQSKTMDIANGRAASCACLFISS